MDILELSITECGVIIFKIELKTTSQTCAQALRSDLEAPPHKFETKGTAAECIFLLTNVDTRDALRLLGVLKSMGWDALSSNIYTVSNVDGEGAEGIVKNFIFSRSSALSIPPTVETQSILPSISASTENSEPLPASTTVPTKAKPRRSISQKFYDLISTKGNADEKVTVLPSTSSSTTEDASVATQNSPLAPNAADSTVESNINESEQPEPTNPSVANADQSATAAEPPIDTDATSKAKEETTSNPPPRRKSLSQRIGSFLSPKKSTSDGPSTTPLDGSNASATNIEPDDQSGKVPGADESSLCSTGIAEGTASTAEPNIEASLDSPLENSGDGVNAGASTEAINDNQPSGTKPRRKSFTQRISSFLAPKKTSEPTGEARAESGDVVSSESAAALEGESQPQDQPTGSVDAGIPESVETGDSSNVDPMADASQEPTTEAVAEANTTLGGAAEGPSTAAKPRRKSITQRISSFLAPKKATTADSVADRPAEVNQAELVADFQETLVKNSAVPDLSENSSGNQEANANSTLVTNEAIGEASGTEPAQESPGEGAGETKSAPVTAVDDSPASAKPRRKSFTQRISSFLAPKKTSEPTGEARAESSDVVSSESAAASEGESQPQDQPTGSVDAGIPESVETGDSSNVDPMADASQEPTTEAVAEASTEAVKPKPKKSIVRRLSSILSSSKKTSAAVESGSEANLDLPTSATESVEQSSGESASEAVILPDNVAGTELVVEVPNSEVPQPASSNTTSTDGRSRRRSVSDLFGSLLAMSPTKPEENPNEIPGAAAPSPQAATLENPILQRYRAKSNSDAAQPAASTEILSPSPQSTSTPSPGTHSRQMLRRLSAAKLSAQMSPVAEAATSGTTVQVANQQADEPAKVVDDQTPIPRNVVTEPKQSVENISPPVGQEVSEATPLPQRRQSSVPPPPPPPPGPPPRPPSSINGTLFGFATSDSSEVLPKLADDILPNETRPEHPSTVEIQQAKPIVSDPSRRRPSNKQFYTDDEL